MITIIHALWNYKSLILGLIKRDFQSRYMNSALGSLWSILNPLAIILVYTLIFSQIMGARLPGDNNTLAYSIYLCAGLLPWQLFSEMLTRLQNIFLEQGTLLKKVSFPRSSLPIYASISATINFIIIFSLYILFLIIIGKFPGWVFVHVFPLLVLQQMFAFGLGIILATLNVFFRDIGHIIGVILQFWSWLTPLVYARSIIPDKFQVFLNWNIMVPLIEGYHSIFLFNKAPDYRTLLPLLCISLLLMGTSYIVFKKLEKEMVDEL